MSLYASLAPRTTSPDCLRFTALHPFFPPQNPQRSPKQKVRRGSRVLTTIQIKGISLSFESLLHPTLHSCRSYPSKAHRKLATCRFLCEGSLPHLDVSLPVLLVFPRSELRKKYSILALVLSFTSIIVQFLRPCGLASPSGRQVSRQAPASSGPPLRYPRPVPPCLSCRMNGK